MGWDIGVGRGGVGGGVSDRIGSIGDRMRSDEMGSYQIGYGAGWERTSRDGMGSDARWDGVDWVGLVEVG